MWPTIEELFERTDYLASIYKKNERIFLFHINSITDALQVSIKMGDYYYRVWSSEEGWLRWKRRDDGTYEPYLYLKKVF